METKYGSSLQAYQQISDKVESKISHRVILDKHKLPIALGLWGRFVIFVKDLGRPKDTIQKQNQEVRAHFRLVIEDSYGETMGNAVRKSIMNTKHGSLRARDVRSVLKGVSSAEETQ